MKKPTKGSKPTHSASDLPKATIRLHNPYGNPVNIAAMRREIAKNRGAKP